MKKFKFRKFVSKTMFTSLLVCLSFGFINVSAGNGLSCCVEPRVGDDGYFVFNSPRGLQSFLMEGYEQYESSGSRDRQGECKIRYIGDVPERAFTCGSYLSSLYVDLVNTTTIGRQAFACAPLKRFNFKEGLRSIGESAFYACRLSGNLVLPNSLEDLGDKAFELNDFESATIPGANLKNLHSECLFNRCSKLNHIKIEQGVESIGRYVFGGEIYHRDMPLMSESVTLEIADSIKTISDSFCICEDGKNHYIKTIIWNGQTFSNCNSDNGGVYYQENLRQFLAAFEAVPGNSVTRAPGHYDGSTTGEAALLPIMYRPIVRTNGHKVIPRARIAFGGLTKPSKRTGYTGRYYYVEVEGTGKVYNSIEDARTAGIDMSFVCYGEDDYEILSIAEAVESLNSRNIPPKSLVW